ncbi:MAG: hypothetical protein ACJAZ1_003549 [Yoonia sp.]|jgi:hypothetical protein
MGHDWIIDVLADIRSFAEQNEMPFLCEQLDDAMLVAAVEVAARRRFSASCSAQDHALPNVALKDHQ